MDKLKDLLGDNNFESYYKKVIDQIIEMQLITDSESLPVYDKSFLQLEMNLMIKYYFEGILKKSLTIKQKDIIDLTLNNISTIILSQPQNIFIHGNIKIDKIMISDNKINIEDPIKTMSGPIVYDLFSLLKDDDFNLLDDEIYSLALYFRDKKELSVSDDKFIKWFDFIGLQRYMKLLGSFSKSFIHDGDKKYLKEIPSTLEYVFDISNKYEETKPFTQLLKEL